jgi:hypothetical protein
LAIGLGLGVADARAGTERVPQPPAAQTVAISQAGDGIIISFQGLSLASLSSSVDGMEAALSFRQPVAESIAGQISHLTPAVTDASSGYDSILLRARSASRFEAMATTGGFVLSIRPVPAKLDVRKLETLDIRRMTLSGDTEGARAQIAALRASQPDDQELLRLDADVAAADHDDRKAAETYAALVSSNPLDESIGASLRSAQAQLAPQVESGVDTRKIEKADRQTHAFASAEIPVLPGIRLRGRIDIVELDDNDVQLPDGARAPFSGDRYGGELGVMLDLGDRWHAMLLAFGNENSLGGGGSIGYRDASSSVELRAVYHQPSWDYPESIVADGTVDESSLSVVRAFEATWFFNASAAVQQFALYGVSDTATNTSVEAGLSRLLFSDDANRVLLSYDFNADFVGHIAERPDGGGGFFTLLPLGDRTVHAGSLRYEGHLTPELLASVRAGYATDANGQDGVITAGELAWSPTLDLRLSLNSYYSGIPDRAGQSGAYMNAGLTITRIFLPTAGSTDGH